MKNNNCHAVVWQLPQNKPTLAEGQVHIWRANLDLSTKEIELLSKFLSSDEIDRAAKFHFPLHRKRFIAARGILRQLLGIYLEVSPDRLTFTYGDRGKPQLELATSAVNRSINFNLSHSQKYAIYGFSSHQPIGVDLEYVRDMPDALKIAQRFFSKNEYKLICNTAATEQNQIFFQLWTAKEAYLKAIGTGLAGSLSSIDLTLNQAQSSGLFSIRDRTLATEWSLCGFIPQQDYVAAIASKTLEPLEHICFWHGRTDLLSNFSN